MVNRLTITKDTIVYVACPANVVTGGPELLHQLVHELNKMAINAYMYYFNTTSRINPVEEAYVKYANKNTTTIEDTNKNYFIVPEVSYAMDLINDFTLINKIIWWLSVDNHFLPKLITNKKYFFFQRAINKVMKKQIFNIESLSLKKFISSDKKISNDILNNVKYHFYQSHYAKNFLLYNQIADEKIFRLSDYLNDDFLNIETKLEEKENIVAYNPRKGYEFTKEIINKAKNIRFIAIENMSRGEVIKLLQKSKVYIDFGNHPGKDRIPREAAILKCCVITNKQGSSQFYEDLAIPNTYKFDNLRKNTKEIIEKINFCMNNFDDIKTDFEVYVDNIKKERYFFLNDIKNIFQLENK